MPVELTHLENGGILIKGNGVLRGGDIAGSNREIYETPEKIRSIAFQICDLTEVEKLEFTPDEIRALAEDDSRAAEINPRMLIAIVGRDDLTYGMARMWQAQVKTPALETSVFRAVEEAEQWIALRMRSRNPMNDDKPSAGQE